MEDVASQEFEFEASAPPTRQEAPSKAVQELWNQRHKRSIWHRLLKITLVVGLLGGAATELVARYYERQLTEAVRIVGGDTTFEVHCNRPWEDVLRFNPPGHVEWGSGVANMQLSYCHDSLSWPDDPRAEDNRIGLMILTHELAHLVNHRNEAETECVAMWAVPKVAIVLGGSELEAEATASWYQFEYNPLLGWNYNAPGCLAGPEPRSPLL